MGFDCRLIAQFCANALGGIIQNDLQLGLDIIASGDRSSDAVERGTANPR